MNDEISVPAASYIIYADDDADERAFLKEIMRQVRPDIEILGMDNGLHVIQFLDKLNPDSPFPTSIVLDLAMPMWDGLRTLRVLKEHLEYRLIPVFLFTNSSN